MAKRKPTKTQQLRKLVQQQVRRMENRGYRIDDAVKEKIKSGKYQTLQSLRRNRYEKLYSSASAEIDSKIVSGTKKRSYERKEVARRAAETRRLNRYVKRRDWLEQRKETPEERRDRESYHDQSYYDEDYEQEWEEQHKEPEYGYDEEYEVTPYEEEKWREQRRLQDERDREQARRYSEGEITYNQITTLIDKYPTPGAKALNRALVSEIGKFGRDKVLQAMSYAPDTMIAYAQQIAFYEDGADAIHSAILAFVDIITGTIQSAEEAMEMGETLDQMTDFQTF